MVGIKWNKLKRTLSFVGLGALWLLFDLTVGGALVYYGTRLLHYDWNGQP